MPKVEVAALKVEMVPVAYERLVPARLVMVAFAAVKLEVDAVTAESVPVTVAFAIVACVIEVVARTDVPVAKRLPVVSAVADASESEARPDTESVPVTVVEARFEVPVAVNDPAVRVFTVPTVARRLAVKKFVAVALPKVALEEASVAIVPDAKVRLVPKRLVVVAMDAKRLVVDAM